MKQWIMAVTGDIGAGKTSAIQQIADPIGEAKLCIIPVGQLMREKVAAGVIGEMKGDLAPEEVMRSTVEEKIGQTLLSLNGQSCVIVIDGVPRFPEQLDWIQEVADRHGVGLGAVFLTADPDAINARLRDRRRADHKYDRQRWENTHIPMKQCLHLAIAHQLPHYYFDTTGSLPQINGMWLTMFAFWLLDEHGNENGGVFK
jgi:adenylate kinase family enzyme